MWIESLLSDGWISPFWFISLRLPIRVYTLTIFDKFSDASGPLKLFAWNLGHIYFVFCGCLFKKLQKQSFADVLRNKCPWKFCKFLWKTPLLESFFNKVPGLKRLQQPVKFAKFSNTFFLLNTSGGCFRKFKMIVVYLIYNTIRYIK